MSLRRILHLVVTSFIGQGVSVLSQLLVPPLFLQFYPNGLEVYGEWIALSAAVNYLGTLNYGVQTYANNQATILHNGGNTREAKTVQGSALRLILILISFFLIAGAVVFFLPITRWLNLKHVEATAAAITLYLLIIQIAVAMLFGLLTNSFMVVGRLPRGNQWINAQRLFSVLAVSVAVWRQASFPVLATIQVGSLLFFLLLVAADVRKTASFLLPSLRDARWAQDRAILKPSAHFVLIALSGFLTWQAPLLLIQKILGPASVAIFALVRVVFQMSRQILSVASFAVGQDITLLVGQKNWLQLSRLYDLSERVVMFLIPVVSIGSLLICPFLFTVWLHKPSLYDPALCLLMAATSAVLGIKEHKTQFQSSSNEHEKLSIIAICGYTAMLLVSIVATRYFGLRGFMYTWFTWEILQTGYVVRLNAKLFPAEFHISLKPIYRLTVFMVVAFAIAAWPSFADATWPLTTVVSVAVAAILIYGVAAYFVFGLADVWTVVQSKRASRKSVLPSTPETKL